METRKQLIKCLICGQHKSNASAEQLKDNLSESSLVCKHLQVIFLLRNILEVPSSQLAIFLQSHPKLESWLSICDKCTLMVDHCKSTYQLILQAQSKFRTVKQEIIQLLKESALIKEEISQQELPLNGYPPPQDKLIHIPEQIRGFVYQNEYPENIDPFISGDLLAYQHLSQKVDRALQQLENEQDDHDDNQSCTGANDDLQQDKWISSSSTDTDTGSAPAPTRRNGLSPSTKVSKKHKRGHFPCPSCPKVFTFQIYLNRHIKFIHDQLKSFQCPLCSSLFPDNCSLSLHSTKCTGTSISCPTPNCPHKFPSDKALTLHLRATHNFSKTEDPRRSCPFCGKYFPKFSLLQRHIRRIHNSQDNLFKCDLCGVAKQSNEDLKNHREICKGTSLSCPDPNCLVKCSTNYSLNYHVRTTHQSDLDNLLPFKCLECQEGHKNFLTNEQLNSHMKKNHRKIGRSGASQSEPEKDKPSESIPCPVPECLLKLSSDRGLKRHLAQYHDPKVIQQRSIQNSCKFCGKFFPKLSILNKHVNSVHQLSDKFKCDACGVGRRSALDLERHRKICKGESLSCPMAGCEMKCVNSLSLNGHVRSTHKDNIDDLLPFKCEECEGEGEGFLNLKHLKNHISWEHRKKKRKGKVGGGEGVKGQLEKETGSWICETCGGSYGSRMSLRNHRRLNVTCRGLRGMERVGGGPVICEICGGNFKGKGVLGTHVKVVHEKRFSMTCEICGVGRNGRRRMDIHMWQRHRMGDGGRWMCGVEGCTVKIWGRKDREDHMRRHRGEEPGYKCEECGKGFYMWANIRQHVKEVHQGKRVKGRGSKVKGVGGVEESDEESNDS